MCEQFVAFAAEAFGGLVVGHGEGDGFEVFEANAGLEGIGGGGIGFESFVGCVHVLVGVAAPLSALVIEDGFREEAGAVVVEVGGKEVTQEVVDALGVVAGDVAVAEVFAHNGGVFALD